MDVKPSNVLIAGDGQPMLLDFHLARGPIAPGEWSGDRLGGTPGWMSPEQEAAMTAVGMRRPIPQAIDRRSDLYALGLLLCETLGGPGAAVDGMFGRPWPRRNPSVSAGLADIVQKCLAPVPTDRYPDAAALADDLQRHLNDLPLRGVVNRSLLERLRKWRRRRPGALARGTAWLSALVAVVVAVGLAGVFYRQRVWEISTLLADGQNYCSDRQYAEAVRVLSRGLEAAESVPFLDRMSRTLVAQLRMARRGQKAAELHGLADLIRFRYGIAPPTEEEARTLVRHCRAVWEEREGLIRPRDGVLAPETERQIRTDLLELAVVWADLRVRLASPDTADEARREALCVLDEADAAFGPSPALDRERRTYAHALGRADLSDGPGLAPQSAWEHYDLGRSYLRSGQIVRAAEEFRRTLDLRPQDFWANFYQGLCAYRLSRFEEAVAAFRTCIALAPDVAQCYYNRALATEALRQTDQARRDYSRALELDPGLSVAALNRGILAYKEGRHSEAIADLRRSLHSATDLETIGRIHYNLALAHRAQGDRDLALSSAEEAMARGYRGARELYEQLRR